MSVQAPIARPQTAGSAVADVPVIRIAGLSRDYTLGSETVHALNGVSLVIHRNEYTAIMGPSGSGKSTLMNIIGCLDTPTAGHYWLNGTQVSRMTDVDLAQVRNREIGFVFQTFNLLPRMTALGNVMLPLMYGGVYRTERHRRARGGDGPCAARRPHAAPAEPALRRPAPARGDRPCAGDGAGAAAGGRADR